MLMESVVQIIKSFNIDSARPASLFGELISSRLKTRHGALHSLCILCSLHIHNSMTDFINAIAIIHKLFLGMWHIFYVSLHLVMDFSDSLAARFGGVQNLRATVVKSS